ncbi:hypothetical protein J7394_22080 [Ruegeria sp. R13_0]|uniref:hypothetical protein n=1 Tax=Ruegeria sp. R13_0 TaxID=2821099 RepID=UPI001ADBAA2E|nr:hypothetical protein [Ruegeria sp. R13_0]MBO9436901.1 hypothetical protein [Ruegeria sp. R13_0]
MLTQTHSAPKQPKAGFSRPVYSDNLMSVVPMVGSVSDLTAAAMIALTPYGASHKSQSAEEIAQ